MIIGSCKLKIFGIFLIISFYVVNLFAMQNPSESKHSKNLFDLEKAMEFVDGYSLPIHEYGENAFEVEDGFCVESATECRMPEPWELFDSVPEGWDSLDLGQTDFLEKDEVCEKDEAKVEEEVEPGRDFHSAELCTSEIAVQQGWTLLHMAVLKNDFLQVKCLLREKVDCNRGDNLGMTSLHYAARNGNSEILDLLLNPCRYEIFRSGAFVNKQDATGWTALHYAIAFKRAGTVSLLIRGGANVNLATNDGVTSFQLIEYFENENLEHDIIEVFHQELEVRDTYEIEDLFNVAVSDSEEDELIRARLLGEFNAEVGIKSAFSRLCIAVLQKKYNIARYLLLQRISLLSVGYNKNNILHIAASEQESERFLYLMYRTRRIEWDLCINEKNVLGQTPLMVAVISRNIPVIALFLALGFDDLNIADNSGETVFDIARKNRLDDVLQVLNTSWEIRKEESLSSMRRDTATGVVWRDLYICSVRCVTTNFTIYTRKFKIPFISGIED